MAFPSRLQQLLEDGRAVIRGMIKYQWGTGTYGVWNGKGSFSYEGITYHANQLVSVEDIAIGLGTAAYPLTIEMPARADFGYTEDKLATIEQQEYKRRPVTISDAFFDPDTRELLHVEPLYYGYVDTIDHVRDERSMKLVIHIETSALDNHKDGYRSASHEDQQIVSPGDRFFQYASLVKTEKHEITM